MAGTSQIAQGEPHAAELMRAADSLLDYLRCRNYASGVDHHLRVERLLASLAARGQLPEGAKNLEFCVRPLVCQSQREQEGFGRDFQEWMRTRGEAEVSAATREQVVQQVLHDVDRGWLRWLAITLVASAIVIVIVIAITFLQSPAKQAPTGGTSYSALSVLGFATGFLILALAAAVLWRRARLRAFLVQQEATTTGSAASLTVAAGVDTPIFSSRLLALAARGFGAYHRIASEDLDVPASVAATSREAGRFVPVSAERPAVPEYLILIDRRSSADLFARFVGGIVQALGANNIALDQFHFDGVPQQCYTARGHRPVTADELVEHYPGHRLLVFSDGSGFVNPVNHQYGPWMQPFVHWDTKTLVTPNAPTHWGAREKTVATAGWAVFAAGQSSIAALAHGVQPEREGGTFVPGVLESIIASQRRWLNRSAPEPEQIADLLMDLRISLGGDAFSWLCACAAYPSVDWVVTMYLGVNLAADDGRPLLRESAFLALSRLPWFRYGRFPEWLRRALLGALSEQQRDRIRHALQVLLASGADGQLDAYRLDFRNEHWRPLNWLTRELIRKRLRRPTEDDPLADAVFLRFLSGANPACLPLPERIANRIRGNSNLWAAVSNRVLTAIGKTPDLLAGSLAAPLPIRASAASSQPARSGSPAYRKVIVIVAIVIALGIVSYWLPGGLGYHYSYVVGALLFDAAWVVCYLVGKKYRPQMIWGTAVTVPLALTSFLFVPQYWTPPSLFDLDARFRVGIEDLLWAGAVGGIASVVTEIYLQERLAARRKQPGKKHYFPFVAMIVVFLILRSWHPGKNIYNIAIAFAVCALIVAFLRSDLILTMLVGAVVFTILYLSLSLYFLTLYPDFVRRYYNLPNLLGIYILGVPVEQLLFATSGGAVWSVAYEYLQGYHFAPGQPFRPVEA